MSKTSTENFAADVARIFGTLRNEFARNPEKFKVPVRQGHREIGYLRPIGRDWENQAGMVGLLAAWRRTHQDAYPTVFPVTEEGTARWIQAQLIERPDRILFLVMGSDDQPVGHMGLANADGEKREIEIDNVIRGVDNVVPGMMSAGLQALTEWAFAVLKVRRLFLRVFKDNVHAVKYYERCGYRMCGEIPLHKFVEGNVTKLEPIPPGQSLSVDRIFTVMETFSPDGGNLSPGKKSKR